MRCCPRHGVALVALRTVESPRSIYDLAVRVRDDRILIRQARQHSRKIPVGNFDRYVADRLMNGRQGASWLDGVNLDVVWRICEMLGIILRHGPLRRISHLEPMQLAAAATAGFDAIGMAKADLIETLRSIHRHSSSVRGGFYSEFRPFYRWLGKLDGTPGFTESSRPFGISWRRPIRSN